MSNTEIIILAAGKGTRMEADVPKVLVPLDGTPMITHVLKAVKETKMNPVMVVGYEAHKVIDHCGDQYTYVIQEEQKGTGHAVLQAKDALQGDTERVVVVYGDQPFVKAQTIESLAQPLSQENARIVLVTALIEDDELFEKQFSKYGRIVRDDKGDISAIVEAKDANEEILKIREVNVGFMAFDKTWAFDHLANLKNDNSQGEYYLTDLVKIAFSENLPIHSVQMEEQEALGANTKEQLEMMETYTKNKA